jgi:hypothetical protein
MLKAKLGTVGVDKSYQGISKPQQNIAENGLSSAKEAATAEQ